MNIVQLGPAAAYVLTDMALISGSSLVYSQSLDRAFATFPFDPARELLTEEVIGRLRRFGPDDAFDFKIVGPPQNMGHLRQAAVPLNLMHSENYFHFLIEALPSLLSLLERGAIDENAIVVSGLLHSNMWAALRYALSGAGLPILQLRPMQMVACDRVVTARPTWHAMHLRGGGLSDSQYNDANLLLLRRRFAPLWQPAAATPAQKIYVRRVSDLRALSNAEEVERRVQEAGYRVVQPEQLNFFEQVELFGSASHIIGPTGAWAANLIFAPDTAKVCVFCPETSRTDRNIWVGLGQSAGIQVDILYCPITKLHKYYSAHSDYAVPPEALSHLLRG